MDGIGFIFGLAAGVGIGLMAAAISSENASADQRIQCEINYDAECMQINKHFAPMPVLIEDKDN